MNSSPAWLGASKSTPNLLITSKGVYQFSALFSVTRLSSIEDPWLCVAGLPQVCYLQRGICVCFDIIGNGSACLSGKHYKIIIYKGVMEILLIIRIECHLTIGHYRIFDTVKRNVLPIPAPSDSTHTRLVHNACRLELKGESIRRKRTILDQ